ncbi:MAG: hypothetical protein V4631_08730 [Pseudomonadota bacterium]
MLGKSMACAEQEEGCSQEIFHVVRMGERGQRRLGHAAWLPVKRRTGADEKRQAEACLHADTGAAYFDAAGAAAAGAEAEADAAAAAFAFLAFLGVEAAAEAEAGAEAMADADAEAEADGAAKATLANREMNRAAMILDICVPFMVWRT